MTDLAPQRDLPQVPSRSLFAFLALTFGITWGVAGLYLLAPGFAVAAFGPIDGTHPFFFLATWSPAIAALVIVAGVGGAAGLAAFCRRLLIWRAPAPWLLMVVVVVPVIFAAGAWMKGAPVLAPLPEGGLGSGFAMLFIMLCLGPIEELGWRGVAQPVLQRHMAPALAGLLLGGVWGLWHLPAFFLSGTVFAAWSFLPFLVGNVALGVILASLLNATRGSLLWPVLLHWQLVNPFWGDAQPYDTWMMVAVAAGVLWFDRARMFARAGAVTDVLAR